MTARASRISKILAFPNHAAGKGRIFGLDCLRCAAILFVLISHLVPYTLTAHPHFGKAITTGRYVLGVLGVELFFTLSGFLIGGILFRDMLSDRFVNVGDVVYFWMRRWLRTLPAYLLVISGLYCYYYIYKITPETDSISNELLHYLTFTQNFFQPTSGFYAVAWSLSVEEWSYILLPALLLLLGRIARKQTHAILSAIIIFMTLPLVWRAFHSQGLDWLGYLRGSVAFRLDALAFGLLAAYLSLSLPSLWKKLAQFGWIGVPFFVGISLALLKLWPMNDCSNAIRVLILPTLACSIALTLPSLCQLKSAPNNWLCNTITYISTISYSIYLIHITVIKLDHHIYYNVFDFSHSRISQLIQYSSTWAAIMIASSFLYFFWEKPIMNLRERLNGIFPTRRRVVQQPMQPQGDRIHPPFTPSSCE